MQPTHSLSAFLYAIAYGIERASYYGIRSILILYMVGETLQMSTTDALSFYGWLTISFYFSKVIGALLGDLLIGNKMAILIGGVLQTLGCFLLCFPNLSLLYISMALLVIGNGLFSPNVLAQFGKQYTNKTKLIDAGFSGLFFFINICAFFGIMLMGVVGNDNFNYGFILGGLLMLIATLMAYFNIDKKSDEQDQASDQSIILKIVFIFIAITITGVFWGVYEISAGLTSEYVSKTSFDLSTWYMLPSISGIVLTCILAVIWTFVYTNQFSKFCVGLLISALAFSLLISFPENPTADGNTTTLVTFGLLLAIGEAFISPLLLAITTRYASPKYLAIVLSLVSLPLLMFNKIFGKIGELTFNYDPSGIFIALTSVLVICGIIAFVMWFIQKQDDKKVFVENDIIE